MLFVPAAGTGPFRIQLDWEKQPGLDPAKYCMGLSWMFPQTIWFGQGPVLLCETPTLQWLNPRKPNYLAGFGWVQLIGRVAVYYCNHQWRSYQRLRRSQKKLSEYKKLSEIDAEVAWYDLTVRWGIQALVPCTTEGGSATWWTLASGGGESPPQHLRRFPQTHEPSPECQCELWTLQCTTHNAPITFAVLRLSSDWSFWRH